MSEDDLTLKKTSQLNVHLGVWSVVLTIILVLVITIIRKMKKRQDQISKNAEHFSESPEEASLSDNMLDKNASKYSNANGMSAGDFKIDIHLTSTNQEHNGLCRHIPYTNDKLHNVPKRTVSL